MGIRKGCNTTWSTVYILNGFIDNISNTVSWKYKTFSGAQKSVRKEVERAFCVLISMWPILSKPYMFHDRTVCENIIEVAIIMHNMIVELRTDGYTSQLFSESRGGCR